MMSDNVFIEETGNFDKSLFSPKSHNKSAAEYVKRQLREYMSTHGNDNHFYKDILRGVLSQIKLGYVDDQDSYKEISLHHGRQERAIAKKFQENNIILPYATIYQSLIEEDKTKRRYEPVLIYRTLWNVATNRAERVVSYPDVPVILNYTLSLWCKYVSDMDQISSNIRSRFNPHLEIKTPETQVMKCFLTEETDRSVVEVNDKEDRIIRKEFTIRIEAYIPSPKFVVTNSTKIKKIKNIIQVDTDEARFTSSEVAPDLDKYYITWD